MLDAVSEGRPHGETKRDREATARSSTHGLMRGCPREEPPFLLFEPKSNPELLSIHTQLVIVA